MATIYNTVTLVASLSLYNTVLALCITLSFVVFIVTIIALYLYVFYYKLWCVLLAVEPGHRPERPRQ